MSRTVTILSAILVVQIILYSILSVDTHHIQQKENFLSVDTSLVNYIKIVNEDGELEMKKVGVNWKITQPINYAANASYIQTLLEKVAAMKKETFITDNPDKYVLYELDEIAAKYVEIGVESGTIQKFYCGKASSTYTHTYVHPAETDEVWLVEGSPRSSFSRKPDQWRDKKILALDRSMIENIVLHHPSQTIELIRQISTPAMDTSLSEPDTSWLAIPGRGASFVPVDKAMNRILNTLKRLNAIEFIDVGSGEIPDFSKPEFTIEITLEGDQHEKIDFIPKADEETRWIARRNDDESTVFIVYQSSVKNLKKDIPALKGEEEKDEDT